MNRKQRQSASVILGLAAFLLLVLIDQSTKKLAVLHLKDQEPVILIRRVFQLFYLENQGAAFGILQGKRSAFIVVTIVILAVIAYCYIRIPLTRRFISLHIVLVLISAGAIGNFIDRFRQGYVVDFLYFNLIHFPVFNVADIYVTIAAILLIFLVLIRYKESDLNELKAALLPGTKKEMPERNYKKKS